MQRLGLQRSLLSPAHCESEQHAAQPSAQQNVPAAQPSWLQSPLSQRSSVHGLPSSQSS
jgi:hypothetical protein